MLILDMTGHVLAWLDANDLGSVVYAERWIREHGYIVYLFEQRDGFTYITVKEAKNVYSRYDRACSDEV